MAASLPALPSPRSWSHLQEYTVVSNGVFRELRKSMRLIRQQVLTEGTENRTTIPEDDCHMVNAPYLHQDEMFLWLPRDNNLWCIPISRGELERRSDCYLMFANEFVSLKRRVVKERGKKARNEAKCVVALARKADHAHLGYYGCNWHNAWVQLERLPLDYVSVRRPF